MIITNLVKFNPYYHFNYNISYLNSNTRVDNASYLNSNNTNSMANSIIKQYPTLEYTITITTDNSNSGNNDCNVIIFDRDPLALDHSEQRYTKFTEIA